MSALFQFNGEFYQDYSGFIQSHYRVDQSLSQEEQLFILASK